MMRKLPKAELRRVHVLSDGTEVHSSPFLYFDLLSYPEGRENGLTPVVGKAYTDDYPFVGKVHGSMPLDRPRPPHRPAKDRETMAVYLADLLLEFIGHAKIERRNKIACHWGWSKMGTPKVRADYVRTNKINSCRRKRITDQMSGPVIFLGYPDDDESVSGAAVLLLDSQGGAADAVDGWRCFGMGWGWQAWDREAQYGHCSISADGLSVRIE